MPKNIISIIQYPISAGDHIESRSNYSYYLSIISPNHYELMVLDSARQRFVYNLPHLSAEISQTHSS
jgi:hypothetical protein